MAEIILMENQTRHPVTRDVDSANICGDLHDRPRILQHNVGQQSWCLRKPSSSENLFMEGFNDCAVEVVRYLTDVERLEAGGPMLRDLQCHLALVGKEFTQSTLAAETQRLEGYQIADTSCRMNLNDSDADSGVLQSSYADSLSPDLSKCDLSKHGADQSFMCQSLTSDLDLSLAGHHDKHIDNVYQSCQSSPSYSAGSVQSLKQLASHALLFRAHHTPPHISYGGTEQLYQTLRCQTLPYPSCEAASTLLHYGLPLDQSSPVLSRSPSDHNLFSPHFPAPGIDLRQQPNSEHYSPLVTCGTTVHSTSGLLPLDITPQQLLNIRGTPPQFPVFTKELAQHVSSVLELRANFLPGEETSSEPSGDLSDVLLAVEMCQFHCDPRVRDLAEEIIHLIHDDYMDDDDEDDDNTFEEDEDDPHRNDESGIEMMDESSDWGNPADLIEQ